MKKKSRQTSIEEVIKNLQVEEERLGTFIRTDLRYFREKYNSPVELPMFSQSSKLKIFRPLRYLLYIILLPMRFLFHFFSKNRNEAFEAICNEVEDLKKRNHDIHLRLKNLQGDIDG